MTNLRYAYCYKARSSDTPQLSIVINCTTNNDKFQGDCLASCYLGNVNISVILTLSETLCSLNIHTHCYSFLHKLFIIYNIQLNIVIINKS